MLSYVNSFNTINYYRETKCSRSDRVIELSKILLEEVGLVEEHQGVSTKARDIDASLSLVNLHEFNLYGS